MTMHRVMVLDAVHPLLPQRLEASGLCEVLDYSAASREEILNALMASDVPVHGLVVRSRMNLDATVLSQAVNLHWIARAGSGYDGIDTHYTASNNIVLFHASEGNRLAVAEHVIAMMLAWSNHLRQGHAQIQQGIWDRESNRGRQLSGTTVGLIGYGHNGSQTARLLAALGCKVLVYDKFLQGYTPAGQEFIVESTMEDLFDQAQMLTLHTPLTELTRNLVQWDFLKRFLRLRLLVNAARGAMVHLPDLLRAIDHNLLEGACLDTLPVEDPREWDPETMKRILTHPRILLSPHVAGWTVESYEAISVVLAYKILAHLQSEEVGDGRQCPKSLSA